MSKKGETRMEVYDYIYDRIKNGYPAPTVREICAELKLKSTSTAHLHLLNLQKEGYIDFDRNLQRTVRLTPAIPEKTRAFKKNEDSERDINRSAGSSVKVPVVGTVAAGEPILAFDDYSQSYDLPKDIIRSADPSETFILTVDGESMIEAGIYTGDMLIVTKSFEAHDGEIVVARIGGESATVKRFYRENGHVRLQPENSSMDPIIVDFSEVEIIGKVIGLIRSY